MFYFNLCDVVGCQFQSGDLALKVDQMSSGMSRELTKDIGTQNDTAESHLSVRSPLIFLRSPKVFIDCKHSSRPILFVCTLSSYRSKKNYIRFKMENELCEPTFNVAKRQSPFSVLRGVGSGGFYGLLRHTKGNYKTSRRLKTFH